MRSPPATSDPFTPATTWLKLSKVPNAIWRAAPPLGAFGLTYSKCLNPAGYFRVPKSDRPWRQTGSAWASRPLVANAIATRTSSEILRAITLISSQRPRQRPLEPILNSIAASPCRRRAARRHPVTFTWSGTAPALRCHRGGEKPAPPLAVGGRDHPGLGPESAGAFPAAPAGNGGPCAAAPRVPPPAGLG